MPPRIPLAVACASLATAILAGCQSAVPVSPVPVNATLAPHVKTRDERQPTAGELPQLGNTRLRARCRTYTEFCQRPRRKDWNEHWFVITADVLSVDRGVWSAPTLTFVTMDLWPTPASGIMLKKEWLYEPGVDLVFELDTRAHPALILGQACLASSSMAAAAPPATTPATAR